MTSLLKIDSSLVVIPALCRHSGIPACLPQADKPGQPAAIQYRTRRLEEFVKQGHNGDADDQCGLFASLEMFSIRNNPLIS